MVEGKYQLVLSGTPSWGRVHSRHLGSRFGRRRSWGSSFLTFSLAWSHRVNFIASASESRVSGRQPAAACFRVSASIGQPNSHAVCPSLMWWAYASWNTYGANARWALEKNLRGMLLSAGPPGQGLVRSEGATRYGFLRLTIGLLFFFLPSP